MIMPNLLLQKPNKNSKIKDHTKAPKKGLQLWTDGHLAELLKGSETIQSSLKYAPKTIAQLSKRFVKQIQKGNVDSAMKLVSNNMQNGILPLIPLLSCITQKHPKSALTTEEIILPFQPESVHQIKYENTNADAVRNPALKTKHNSELSAWMQMVGKGF